MFFILISLAILVFAFLLYKKYYDIFTDKGSLRKLIDPMNFNLVILILLVVQLSCDSIIFYIFCSYFNFAINISQAILAGAVSTILYSSSFLIFKNYGPYILFSFDKVNRGSLGKNFLLLTLWLFGVSVIEGSFLNITFGMDIAPSIFVSFFAICVIAFVAT